MSRKLEIMIKDLSDFVTLPEYTQFRYLAVNSVYIMARIHDGKECRLYACLNFYMEMRYDETGSGIEDMRVFTGTARLAPYLHRITLCL